MKIYNTLTKQIDEFKPHDGNNVKMYTCGPTVYHFAHIGNLRTYIFEDIFEKGLNYLGYNVKRVMNITDVGHLTSDSDTGEDKMLKGARREHKTVYEIADFYTKAFFEDTKKLNIKKPETVEKASDHIDFYIKMIEKLIEKDYAYLSNGNVYFDISKANDYYKLSGKSSNDLIVGAREDVDLDIHKKNPADFVLWFTTSKFENQAMVWDSPWGVGYPGWHIECSGISIQFLGEYLDIHCGGVDNIFPHHTNEIAQSEAYLGHKWCPYWVHGEHLNDQSGKMSKSNGEFLTLSLLEEKGYNPLVYRLFNFSCHYKGKLNFTWDGIESASTSLNRLREGYQKHLNGTDTVSEDVINDMENRFHQAINDDLNMPLAMSVVWEAVKYPEKSPKIAQLLEKFDTVLGIKIAEKKEEQQIPQEVLDLVEQRKVARSEKNWAESDRLRDLIIEKGYNVKDTKEGVEVSKL